MLVYNESENEVGKRVVKQDVRFAIQNNQNDESDYQIRSDSDEAEYFEDEIEPTAMKGIFQNDLVSARITSANPVSSQTR